MKNKKYAIILGVILLCLVVGAYAAKTDLFEKIDPRKISIEEGRLYKVVYVIDGDTFTVNVNGKEAKIRLLGVDTPETVDKRKGVQCFGPEASAETKSLLKGKGVRFESSPGRETKDRYGRFLLYVYREDGLFINEYLIRNGYAREYTFGGPYTNQTKFMELEVAAKEEKTGLWGACSI